MQLIEIPVCTDTESAILSNLPNGSDIDEDVQMFGKRIVDALAAKLEAKAIEASQALAVRDWSAEEENTTLMILIECVLNLQRMKRYKVVKRLAHLDEDCMPHLIVTSQSTADITKDEDWVICEIKNGVPVASEQERIGKAAMDTIVNKLFAKAVSIGTAVASHNLGHEEERKALRTYLGLARTLNYMRESKYVRQLMGI